MRRVVSHFPRCSPFASFLAVFFLVAIAPPVSAALPPNAVIVQDWRFEGGAGQRLDQVLNHVASGSLFPTSPAESFTTADGTFRVQRPPLTRLFGSAPLTMPAAGKMWIVADIAGWNLESDVSDFRLGFANSAGNPDSTNSSATATDNYILAEFSLRRSGLGGFSASGAHIPRTNPGNVLTATRATPIRLVLEHDRDNHTYAVFFSTDNQEYTVVGSGSTPAGFTPNFLRFMALNSFAQPGTFFDINRVFVAIPEPPPPPPPPAGNITLVGHANPFGQQYGDVKGDGNLAAIGTFLNTTTNGVGIFDISNPANPILLGNYAPSGTRFQDAWIRNGIGYFGCWRVTPTAGNNGVHIVNLANPANPILLARINTTNGGHGQVHTLFIDGNFLYTASHRANAEGRTVKVFNIANPANPQFVRSIQTTDPQRIHQITVRNGRLYTSGWGGHTDIFDVSNVTVAAPLLGTVMSGSNSHSSWPAEDGNTLVSAREIVGGDVRFFDISNPADPQLILTLTHDMVGISDHIPHNPVIVGDLLFLSWYENGLQVFNIANPAEPVRVGYFSTGGFGSSWDGNWGVYPLLGLDRVLLSDMSTGFFVVDATGVVTNTDNYPPLLVKLPGSAERVEGSNVEFSVVATGSASLAYQWYRNNQPISGANSSTLTLTQITLSQGGEYRVKVTNAAGEITSRVATLSVVAGGDAVPPSINAHPTSQTVNTGQMVTFSVTVSGTPQLRYQWYFGDDEIPGAEESSLTVGPVMLKDAGNYRVRVWNASGEVLSDPATLTIDDPGFIYGVRISVGPDGAVVSWRTLEPATGYVEWSHGHHHHEPSPGGPGAITPMHAEFDYATPRTLHPSTSHSAFIGGLHPESKYSYSVTAHRHGIRYESPEFLFVTPEDEKGGATGVPEWWLRHFFDAPVADDFDADGDGYTVWEEFFAGTSPIDPESRPMVSILQGETHLKIHFWPAYSWRHYCLENSGTLQGDWEHTDAPKQFEEGRLTFRLDDLSAERRFFRVKVEPLADHTH